MCAIPTAKVGAPPARPNIVSSPSSCASCFISVSVTGNPAAETFATTSLGVPLALIAKYWPGRQNAGRDQGHQRDHHLGDHRPVADVANPRLALDHFRRRAGSDQGMKPGDRAAGDRDADERKNRSGKDQPRAVDEGRQGRHLQGGMNHDHRQRERRDRAQFQKRAEVIARGEEEPDRQSRGGEAVKDQRPGEPFLIVAKPVFDRRVLAEKLTAPDGEKQTEDTENRHPADADPPAAKRDPHEERDRDRHRDRENAPRTFGQRLHHDEREDRDQHDHDGEHADEGERARPRFRFPPSPSGRAFFPAAGPRRRAQSCRARRRLTLPRSGSRASPADNQTAPRAPDRRAVRARRWRRSGDQTPSSDWSGRNPCRHRRRARAWRARHSGRALLPRATCCRSGS